MHIPGIARLPGRPPEDVLAMRRAGVVVGETLDALARECVAGWSTADLEARATEFITARGARPSFPEVPGYRHTLCVSVNEHVIHGLPHPRPLVDGDLVSIDCGAIVDGWHGDAAVSFIVGGRPAASAADLALLDATQDALWAGIAAFVVGGRLHDVGAAIEDALDEAAARPGAPARYGIVDGYEGHGIGRAMHLPPGVPNVRTRRRGPRIRAGATVAIEPMVTLGTDETRVLPDGWTVVTLDGSRAAHAEHTVAATPDGPWVLTALDGGAAELSRRGVRCGSPR